jgi:hypothetical protein
MDADYVLILYEISGHRLDDDGDGSKVREKEKAVTLESLAFSTIWPAVNLAQALPRH